MISVCVDGKEYNAYDKVPEDFPDITKDQLRSAIKRAREKDKKEFVFNNHTIQFIDEKKDMQHIRAKLSEINRPALIGSSQKVRELGEAFDALKNFTIDLVDMLEETDEWRIKASRAIRALGRDIQ